MLEDDCRMDALEFWLMHEKILLTDANEHRAKSLNFLGNISAHCSRTTQNIENLNQAICAYSDAVRDDPTNLTYRFNFGNSLTERFDRVGDLADVDEAVVVCREAVRLSPDGQPPQELALLALGLSLHRRFLRLSILSDIDESIALLRKGVTLLPDGHRAKGFLLSALGDSLRCRFERLGDLGYINASISLLSEAVAPLPDGHPAKALWLGKLGFSLLRRFDRLGDVGDLDHSLSVLRTSVRLSPSGEEKTFSLGMLGNCLRIRFERFKSVDDLNESVRMLKEATALCPDMHPDKSNFLNILGRVLMHRFDQLDKFDDLREFLLSKPMSKLSLAATRGPVVLLNISALRCDALVLMPGLDDVLHIPLPDFTFDDAEKLRKTLGTLLRSYGRSARLIGQQEAQIHPEQQFAHILAELWVRVAKPILDAMGHSDITPSREDPQRVWWCPTGPLAFLPIHAAGLYGDNDGFGSKLSDFVISSYTPSLTALIEGFRSRSEPQGSLRLLAVAQPSAEDQAYIPAACQGDSHSAVEGRCSDAGQCSKWNEGFSVGALRLPWGSKRVCSNRECSPHHWKFSADPFKIIQLSLPNADFAFLSACQTATGADDLQDESVHLAAGMLLAGYRGVVATMWSIMDQDAPQVAADVYEHLFDASPPDSTRAAQALHLAVRRLREESRGKKSFFNWVPFIHIGI
ncbi:CHAT domain-containing protein [Mycena galericulata]|nr:CHAT domain-containing protein [Mycena galericulata]